MSNIKQGIDFAGWDTHIFDDDQKIFRLIDAQGPKGFYIYFWFCQKAYALNGYYYCWSYADAAVTAGKMAGRIRSETVKSTVGTCCKVGLFDNDLLESAGILTSRGIQRRFMAAVQKRGSRTVDKRYWLLDEAETKAGKITFFEDDFAGLSDSIVVDDVDSPENGTFFEKVGTFKRKESKDLSSEPADAGTDIESEKEKQVKLVPQKNFDHEHKAFKLAAYLDKKISERSPYYKRKPEEQLQKWAVTFDRMYRLDNIPWDDIRDVLVFSQQNDFWQNNILSPDKFRKQFVQLEAKMTAEDRA